LDDTISANQCIQLGQSIHGKIEQYYLEHMEEQKLKLQVADSEDGMMQGYIAMPTRQLDTPTVSHPNQLRNPGALYQHLR
jgi:hypothetical protein